MPKRICSHLAISLIVALAACKPPAADEYVERIAIEDSSTGPSVPVDSPDTEAAVWADSAQANRLLYGRLGEPAIMALACEVNDGARQVHLTRFIAADADAKALMALIGNGHIARLPVDTVWNGKFWLWEGIYDASNPKLDVLTGPRQVEATIPGAGSVILNPSQRPAQLIDRCRQSPEPAPQPELQPD